MSALCRRDRRTPPTTIFQTLAVPIGARTPRPLREPDGTVTASGCHAHAGTVAGSAGKATMLSAPNQAVSRAIALALSTWVKSSALSNRRFTAVVPADNQRGAIFEPTATLRRSRKFSI